MAINVHGSSHVTINVHSNYYMVEGTPHGCAHVWQLKCTVITRIWWRGAIITNRHQTIFSSSPMGMEPSSPELPNQLILQTGHRNAEAKTAP